MALIAFDYHKDDTCNMYDHVGCIIQIGQIGPFEKHQIAQTDIFQQGNGSVGRVPGRGRG